MQDRFALSATALLGFLAVVAGAIGSHPPEGFLDSPSAREGWNTAAAFLLFHALAALAIADLPKGSRGRFRATGNLFLLGAVLFSGSIFGLAAGLPSWLGPVTPLGGLFLLAGWLVLAVQLARGPR